MYEPIVDSASDIANLLRGIDKLRLIRGTVGVLEKAGGALSVYDSLESPYVAMELKNELQKGILLHGLTHADLGLDIAIREATEPAQNFGFLHALQLGFEQDQNVGISEYLQNDPLAVDHPWRSYRKHRLDDHGLSFNVERVQVWTHSCIIDS